MNKIQNLKNKLESLQTKLKSTTNFNDKMTLQMNIMNIFDEINQEQAETINKQNFKIAKEDKKLEVAEAKKTKKTDRKSVKVLDTQVRGYVKNFKKIEKDITAQNKAITRKETNLNKRFKIEIGNEYYINVQIYKSYFEGEEKAGQKRKQIKAHYQMQTDSEGVKYTHFLNRFNYRITDPNISVFTPHIMTFINENDDNDLLNLFCKMFFASDAINGNENLKTFKPYFNGVVITAITPIQKQTKYKKPDFLDLKYYEDENKKAIYSRYTKYEINQEATSLKDLVRVPINDYLKEHFRPNCCMLTCIINKFHGRFEAIKSDGKRRFKALTYDSLCELLNLTNRPEGGIGCSINQAVFFFEKYKLGLFVYDMYMNLIFKFEPENPANTKSYTVLRVMCKDSHIYELNNDIKTLQQKVSMENHDICVGDKYTINNFDDSDEYNIHMIDNMADIVELIKTYDQADKKKLIKLKLITNADISELLIEIFSNGYIPKVFYNQYIYKINFQLENIFATIETNDISTQNEPMVIIENVEEYKEFKKADNKFYEAIVKPDLISTYHETVLTIESEYKIIPISGYFVETNVTANGLDQRKAYTSSLKEISVVPVFSYFDVYRNYNNEPIDDYTYYIVQCLEFTEQSSLIFTSTINRLYGFVLKAIAIKYKIISFRKPFKLVDVDYHHAINELYANDKIDSDKKKYIVNKLTGLLEKRKNQNHQTKFFDDYNHALFYSIKYNGHVMPVVKNSFDVISAFSPIDDEIIETCVNKSTTEFYMVNVKKEKQLTNGFCPIKDIIYCKQKLNIFNTYNKMISSNLKVLGVKTDCIFYAGSDAIIKKNFNLNNEIGCYKIETGKYLSDKPIEITENKLIDIFDFNNIVIKTFVDEYDTQEINKYLTSNKVVMLKGKYPGVGKTEAIKKFGKKTLFILPENTLCRDIIKSGYDAVTFSKMFGLYADDIELKNKGKRIYNLNDYEAVCFDEIAKHSPDRLKRIAQFIQSNPDKFIFGAGDYKQIKPINYGGSQNYLDDCINIIFPNQILLSEIKRLENKDDVIKMKNLYEHIFSSDKVDLKAMCKQFNIKSVSSHADVKTVNNLAFFNFRCDQISSNIHHNVLNNKNRFMVNQDIVCRKYYKTTSITLNTNYTYKIVSFPKGGNVCIFDDVDEKYYTIPMNLLEKHFILPYCRTIDSSQGRSISEKMTIFDLNLPYVSREHMWVALTRCRNLSDLTVFIHSDEEVKRFSESKIKQYYSFKVENYKMQDINANRDWVDSEYIDTKFIMDQVKICNMKCSYCLKDIQVFINEEGNVFSDLTIDRKDNKKAHTKLNCKLCCLTCNVSKK